MKNKTHEVKIGNKVIGGGHPVAIQSMCNTATSDIDATVAQILSLEDAGCEIVRVAVPNEEAARAIAGIREQIHIPLIADIHFDYRLALMAIDSGADKIRINPGNIGGRERLKAVVTGAAGAGIAIRVGVNSGSLEQEILERYGGHVTAEGLVESALQKTRLIEEMGFGDIVISIKSSDVLMSVRAYELISERTDHPLHVGITEAGTILSGSVKSALGLGIILHEGIGDTIRVSLTSDPIEEVRVAKLILSNLGMRRGGIEVISCPTCGRTGIDLIGLTKEVERIVSLPRFSSLDLKVACMGCEVNGPGEAREADIGICGGRGFGLIIKKGKIIKKVEEDRLLSAFTEELESFLPDEH